MRAIAVLSEKRVATLPNVPTSTEAGFPNFKMSILVRMMAQRGPRARSSAPATIDRTGRSTTRPCGTTWPRRNGSRLGTPEQMGNLVKNEMARYREDYSAAGIKKDAL